MSKLLRYKALVDLYHVLNRGVDKRTIFLDNKDYLRFIYNLAEFNDQKWATLASYRFKSLDIASPKLIDKPRNPLVDIHAFCLMPNHYHLLLSPKTENGISQFMKKINMGYAKYFNLRYTRVGALFQGRYKSVPIMEEDHFLHLPYYIHMNPLDLFAPEWRRGRIRNPNEALRFLENYKWSSFSDYIGKNNFPFVINRDLLSKVFEYENGHRKHVLEWLRDMDLAFIQPILLE